MRQNSLFEEDSSPGRQAVQVLGVAGSVKALSKVQRQFNQLIDRLRVQRAELARWRVFQQSYHRQLADRYEPLAKRLREKRLDMVILLDRAMDGDDLGKRERDKVRVILGELLAQLLDEGEEPSLVDLHDKYSRTSFADRQRDDRGADETAVGETLVGETSEGETGGDEDVTPRAKKKSTKASLRAALAQQLAEGGTRAVRETYRKLVSELHPDRESDPKEQVRKTELMQRVNQAYKAGDLLGLLELQVQIEQIDSIALAGLTDERLRHYVHVLEEQSRELRAELADVVAPFARIIEVPGSGKVTPETVQRALDADLRELRSIVAGVEADLLTFRDIRLLKQGLRHYRIRRSEGSGYQGADL